MTTNKSSIDGIDCITADYTEEEPLEVCDDSSDPMQDSDVSESEWADKATIPSRDDQGPSHFAGIGFDAATLPSPGVTPLFLLETHSFYCLHKHLRERAPPTLV